MAISLGSERPRTTLGTYYMDGYYKQDFKQRRKTETDRNGAVYIRLLGVYSKEMGSGSAEDAKWFMYDEVQNSDGNGNGARSFN